MKFNYLLIFSLFYLVESFGMHRRNFERPQMMAPRQQNFNQVQENLDRQDEVLNLCLCCAGIGMVYAASVATTFATTASCISEVVPFADYLAPECCKFACTSCLLGTTCILLSGDKKLPVAGLLIS